MRGRDPLAELPASGAGQWSDPTDRRRNPSSDPLSRATFSRKGRRTVVLLATLALAACSSKPADVPVTYLDLDCAKPFDAQVATITAQPKLVPAGTVGSEPYSYYSSADGSVSYLVTRKGSPAHPAIMIQRARNGVHTSGCAYGSKKAYDELLAYLESLKTWTRKGGTSK